MKAIPIGSCVQIPDGRIGRVREKKKGIYKVRIRRTASKTHQFLFFRLEEIKIVDCPKGWMSREGYMRYLQITLKKMAKRRNVRLID